MRQRLMAMLDVVSIVQAVRRGMLQLDRGSALLVLLLAGPGALVTGIFTWTKDWLPTWRFANGEPPGDYGYSMDSIAVEAVNSAGALVDVVDGLANISLGVFIGATLAVGVTLLPTIVQFLAPRIIHPVMKLFVDVSIGFDFITDWPAAWEQAGHATMHPVLRTALTIILVLIYSLLLQSLFVIMLAAFVMAVIVIIAGDRRSGHHGVVLEA